MIINVAPDRQKAASLRKMAEITLQRLQQTNMEEYPSNTLTDFYDVIHKLMDAIVLRKGIKIKGDGAHQELIEYLAHQGEINEQTRAFLQQMREYRNNISYEGFMVPKTYIVSNKEKVSTLIKHLF